MKQTEGVDSELLGAAERAVMDMLRQAGEMDFWRGCISRSFGPGELAGWLKLKPEVVVEEPKLRRAVGGVRREYGSFVVGVDEDRDETGRAKVTVVVQLRDGAEWKDAWEEAWTFEKQPNLHGLSDSALRLYKWAMGPKNTGAPRERRIIGLQSKLGKMEDLEKLLREIRQRADPGLRWEKVRGGRCAKLRVWFERFEARFYDYGPINPALGLDVFGVRRVERERFRDRLYEEMMGPGFPEGTEKVGVFDIRDRKTLKSVFRQVPRDCDDEGPLAEFFDSVRLMDGLELRRTFEPGAGPWLVVCEVQAGTSWAEVKARLRAKANAIPMGQRYSLSADGRALLKWILELRKEEFLLGMTPEVEERMREDIGIETELGGGNARTYLELLVEEINEKTEFQLRTITWRHYAREGTRILVKKKGSRLDEVVRAVQGFALADNKVLDARKVRDGILGLIRDG